MASKQLPRFRKALEDDWSKRRHTVHIAGQLRGEDDMKWYGIYPEPWTENANIIISQLDRIIREVITKVLH